MASISSEYTSTIEEFIASESTSQLSYDILSIYNKVNNFYMITYNVLNDYLSELKSSAETYKLTDKEYATYKYKPRILAYDIYGSTELYFVILKVNDMCDEKQFSKRTIKLIPPSKLESILSYIYQSQSDILTANKSNITS